ncbi:hypothetical protein ATK36_5782 [Amycolatopsis sulphurea]|uniref:Uncharacterized protein n=1 Tax=Amycolatopsis sulphurea TaxID=76022 RepID=A0A2A9FIZ1_9PSEU|nr:hypothetical protein ATK36_5782 [Amycolatopsis sulphurea]
MRKIPRAGVPGNPAAPETSVYTLVLSEKWGTVGNPVERRGDPRTTLACRVFGARL